MSQVKSAGVVPYAINARGEVCFLLGREGYVQGWRESDKWGFFGGKIEKSDACVEHGAARECYEETAGCVMSYGELRQLLLARDYALMLDAIFKTSRTVYYFVQVAFKDYPSMFRNTKQFVQYCNGKVDCIEKSQLKWFGYNELHSHLFETGDASANYFSYNRRKPYFRRKFIEIMRFFYENNGIRFLRRPSPAGSASPPLCRQISFHVEMKNGQSARNSEK